ncbi:DsrE family protein [Maribellus maritimus]|uniref:DsrE family protein n=1 Tax=Maribellus maritimus TaxID=2870838 RepID=UPI001EEA26EE|nr:DsrE family protein [Maribellus maritimus]
MKNRIFILMFILIGFSFAGLANEPFIESQNQQEEIPASEKLVVLWASGDKEVAEKMVLMYTFNSKRFEWWKDITLVIWGPSQKVMVENPDIQDYVKKIMEQGTEVKACKGCSDMYGISEKLEELGVEVRYMGEITDYMKEGRHILSL